MIYFRFIFRSLCFGVLIAFIYAFFDESLHSELMSLVTLAFKSIWKLLFKGGIFFIIFTLFKKVIINLFIIFINNRVVSHFAGSIRVFKRIQTLRLKKATIWKKLSFFFAGIIPPGLSIWLFGIWKVLPPFITKFSISKVFSVVASGLIWIFTTFHDYILMIWGWVLLYLCIHGLERIPRLGRKIKVIRVLSKKKIRRTWRKREEIIYEYFEVHVQVKAKSIEKYLRRQEKKEKNEE